MDLRVSNDVSALLFPPLKKGGRGDLLLLFAEAEQQQIPPSIAARSPTPFFKGGESKALPSEVADMADVANTAMPNVSATVMAVTATAVEVEAQVEAEAQVEVEVEVEVATMTNINALFPPLKKGGRGDLLLLFAKAEQQQIPPSIASRSSPPSFKGCHSNNHRRAECSGSHA